MHALRLIWGTPRYTAVAWVFATLNILTGTWVLYIPQLREQLSLTDGQLGMVLFCFPVGVLLALPFVPKISRSIGLGKLTHFGVMLLPIWYVLMVQAPHPLYLGAALLLAGICSGTVDVAMNALVSHIETTDGVKIMSTAHGFFSLGGVIGAGTGAVLADVVSIPAVHMLILLVILTVTNAMLAGRYKHIVELPTANTDTTNSYKLLLPLIGLAAVALMIMMNEGAVEHWSKLYMLDVVQVQSQSVAAIGFIAFSALMTAGRFLGDTLQTMIGSSKLLIYGMLLAVVGHAGILSAHVSITVVGFGVLGLGLSVVIPELFRLALRLSFAFLLLLVLLAIVLLATQPRTTTYTEA